MKTAGRLLAWARVLRLSLFPSAIADPVVGASLGTLGLLGSRAQDWTRLGLACLASLCVYHGAMALNDWADRVLDAKRGRARPLPLGELSPKRVLQLAALLLLAGPGIAFFGELGPFACSILATTAIIASAYDLFGRGAWLGPALLASARALNLLFGAAALGWTPEANSLPPIAAGVYAVFVFLIGRLGRMEDGEDEVALGQRPSWHLKWLALLLLGGPIGVALLLRFGAQTPSSVWIAWAAFPIGLAMLWSRTSTLLDLSRTRGWSCIQVEAAMGPVLGCLVPFTTGMMLLSVPGPTSWLVAAGLLAAAQLGRRMMTIIPPS